MRGLFLGDLLSLLMQKDVRGLQRGALCRGGEIAAGRCQPSRRAHRKLPWGQRQWHGVEFAAEKV